MEFDIYLLMALLPIILIPPLIYYRQKVFRKKSAFVSAQCPECMGYQDLKGVQNYTCKHCSTEIAFYDSEGEEIASIDKYECAHCGDINYKGILTCVSCGLTNKAGIPS